MFSVSARDNLLEGPRDMGSQSLGTPSWHCPGTWATAHVQLFAKHWKCDASTPDLSLWTLPLYKDEGLTRMQCRFKYFVADGPEVFQGIVQMLKKSWKTIYWRQLHLLILLDLLCGSCPRNFMLPCIYEYVCCNFELLAQKWQIITQATIPVLTVFIYHTGNVFYFIVFLAPRDE
jgi:hypothetical protein